jgi:hypothetical protein
MILAARGEMGKRGGDGVKRWMEMRMERCRAGQARSRAGSCAVPDSSEQPTRGITWLRKLNSKPPSIKNQRKAMIEAFLGFLLKV